MQLKLVFFVQFPDLVDVITPNNLNLRKQTILFAIYYASAGSRLHKPMNAIQAQCYILIVPNDTTALEDTTHQCHR